MRKDGTVAASLGLALLLSLAATGCKRSNTSENNTSAAPPRGLNGQMETVPNPKMATTVNSASGAAATTPPKPATQPTSRP